MSGLLKALALVAASRGDYTQEEAYLQEGLNYARQIGDRVQMCVLLMNLGATTAEQGHYNQAEEIFQEGLFIARKIGHRDWTSALLSNLGDIAVEKENYEQATIYLQEGLQLARQTGNREWLSLLISNLGLTTRMQGDYLRAEDYLQEGLKIAWEIGTPLIIANVLYELGNLYLDKRQIEAAYETFSEMQNTIHEGDQELIALSQFGLARIAAEQNNIEEARRLGVMSLEALGAMGNRNSIEVRAWLNTITA